MCHYFKKKLLPKNTSQSREGQRHPSNYSFLFHLTTSGGGVSIPTPPNFLCHLGYPVGYPFPTTPQCIRWKINLGLLPSISSTGRIWGKILLLSEIAQMFREKCENEKHILSSFTSPGVSAACPHPLPGWLCLPSRYSRGQGSGGHSGWTKLLREKWNLAFGGWQTP